MTALVATKTDGVVARLDVAARLLQEATTPQAMKQVLDVAHAALEYAKRQKLGEEVIQYANCVKVDAEWRLGKMLEATPNAKPGPKSELGADAEPNSVPTLSELGIDKKTSSRAQKLAALPEHKVDAIKAGTTTITKALREVEHESRPAIPLVAAATYRVVYADPPWEYGNSGLQQYGHASHHYPAMSISQLCQLPVEEMVADDAVLFLWVTSPLLESAFQVIRAWGFKYKTSFVWDKVKHNFGHYNSVRHEFLLVCTCGSCVPDVAKLFDSVQCIERSDKHSEKPEQFRQIIDTIYPAGKRIELFARSEHNGWDRFGNEP